MLERTSSPRRNRTDGADGHLFEPVCLLFDFFQNRQRVASVDRHSILFRCFQLLDSAATFSQGIFLLFYRCLLFEESLSFVVEQLSEVDLFILFHGQNLSLLGDQHLQFFDALTNFVVVGVARCSRAALRASDGGKG